MIKADAVFMVVRCNLCGAGFGHRGTFARCSKGMKLSERAENSTGVFLWGYLFRCH